MMKNQINNGQRFGFLYAVLILLAAWVVTGLLIGWLRGIAFPMPWDAAARVMGFLKGERLYDASLGAHILSSLWRWAAGYGLAAVLGIFTGLTLGAFPRVRRIVMPAVYVIQMVPGLAWIPIALLVFGIGSGATVFMIFIMGFTPIVLSTAGGIQAIPPVQLDAARMMGAGRKALFFRVMAPAAMGSILSGLRIGMAAAWRVLIAAEMVVGMGRGLGYAIIQSRWSMDYEAAFVSVGVIILIGLFLEKTVFGLLEARLPYSADRHDT